MIWIVSRDCTCRNTDSPNFGDSRFKAWRVGYSRHSFTTWFSSLQISPRMDSQSDRLSSFVFLLPRNSNSQSPNFHGTYLNWTESQRLPRITSLCNVSHQVNSLKVFSLPTRNSQANLQWIVLVSSTIVSTDFSLTTNSSHFSRSTGISSHFSHRISHFFST